jgi:N-acetylglucosaminyl-diphospho-decaprenol L-rhamnosyltransferase
VSGSDTTLVTVTHNSRYDLERLLDSVLRHLPDASVVVADSGSADGGPNVARAQSGLDVEVLELGGNVGFGRGANAGLQRVKGPVTVLVNPDVELLDGSLALLATELVRPGAPQRLLGPEVLHPDGTREDSAQLRPTSAAAMVGAAVPPAALPGPLRTRVEPWRSAAPRRVDWLVGCCLAGRTDTLRRLGPFDERIFLYAEDLELGLRAGALGVQSWFWPAARVVHHGHHATHAAWGGEPFELKARQRRAVVNERLGPARLRLDDLLQLATFAERLALKRLLRRPAERERRQLAALRAVRSERPSL